MSDNIDDPDMQRRVVELESAMRSMRDEKDLNDNKQVKNMVEDALRPYREKHYDSYKAYTTILFTALAVLVGVLGVLSRIEVRDQVKEMQSKFEKQEKELIAQFEKLAGEALKRPFIELLLNDETLEGRSIDIPFFRNHTPNYANLNTLFIRNTGDKNTDLISMRISIGAGPFIFRNNRDAEWELSSSPDKSYSVSFYSKRQIVVHPNETLNVHTVNLEWNQISAIVSGPTNINCKIEVFYGGVRPAEAKFNLNFKPQQM